MGKGGGGDTGKEQQRVADGVRRWWRLKSFGVCVFPSQRIDLLNYLIIRFAGYPYAICSSTKVVRPSCTLTRA